MAKGKNGLRTMSIGRGDLSISTPRPRFLVCKSYRPLEAGLLHTVDENMPTSNYKRDQGSTPRDGQGRDSIHAFHASNAR